MIRDTQGPDGVPDADEPDGDVGLLFGIEGELQPAPPARLRLVACPVLLLVHPLDESPRRSTGQAGEVEQAACADHPRQAACRVRAPAEPEEGDPVTFPEGGRDPAVGLDHLLREALARHAAGHPGDEEAGGADSREVLTPLLVAVHVHRRQGGRETVDVGPVTRLLPGAVATDDELSHELLLPTEPRGGQPGPRRPRPPLPHDPTVDARSRRDAVERYGRTVNRPSPSCHAPRREGRRRRTASQRLARWTVPIRGTAQSKPGS